MSGSLYLINRSVVVNSYMPSLFYRLYKEHKFFWNKEHLFSVVVSWLLLLLALFIQREADIYVSSLNGLAVSDVFLNFLPALDIDPIVVQGALLLTLLVILLLISKPKYLSFTTKAVAIFIIIRSFFITLTHLGANPNQLVLDTNNFGFNIYDLLFNSKNDFFFSGHTGLPFLMALIFWQEKFWRYLFLSVSFIFAVSVLILHIHYSIDVFAAPFITYSIFAISKFLFSKDYKLISADTD